MKSRKTELMADIKHVMGLDKASKAYQVAEQALAEKLLRSLIDVTYLQEDHAQEELNNHYDDIQLLVNALPGLMFVEVTNPSATSPLKFLFSTLNVFHQQMFFDVAQAHDLVEQFSAQVGTVVCLSTIEDLMNALVAYEAQIKNNAFLSDDEAIEQEEAIIEKCDNSVVEKIGAAQWKLERSIIDCAFQGTETPFYEVPDADGHHIKLLDTKEKDRLGRQFALFFTPDNHLQAKNTSMDLTDVLRQREGWSALYTFLQQERQYLIDAARASSAESLKK